MTRKRQKYSFCFKRGDITHMKHSEEEWKMDLKPSDVRKEEKDGSLYVRSVIKWLYVW